MAIVGGPIGLLPHLTFVLWIHRCASSTAERFGEFDSIPQRNRGAILAGCMDVGHDDLHVVLRSHHRAPVLKEKKNCSENRCSVFRHY